MLRRASLLLLLLSSLAAGCGGTPKGGNQDLDRPKPTPSTNR